MTDKARSYEQGCDVVPSVRTGARAMHQDYGSAPCITPSVDADSAAAAIDVQGLWHCGQSIGESSKYVIARGAVRSAYPFAEPQLSPWLSRPPKVRPCGSTDVRGQHNL